jgi:hypothetical protein
MLAAVTLTFAYESVHINTSQYFCFAEQRHPAENSSFERAIWFERSGQAVRFAIIGIEDGPLAPMFIIVWQQSSDYLSPALTWSTLGVTQPYDFPADRVLTIKDVNHQVMDDPRAIG